MIIGTRPTAFTSPVRIQLALPVVRDPSHPCELALERIHPGRDNWRRRLRLRLRDATHRLC
jgi:hypothetical protein